MSRFSELGTNKFTILMKLISKPEIVKCLVSNEPNFLDVPLPVDFEPSSLVCSSIYPYRYIPTIQTEPKTFITMKFGYKPEGVTFKNGSIYFYIIVHNSLLKTEYGSLRYDMLLDYIDDVFNSEQDLKLNDSFCSSRDLGVGKLPFYETDEFIVNENYSGVYIAYKTKELNDFR